MYKQQDPPEHDLRKLIRSVHHETPLWVLRTLFIGLFLIFAYYTGSIIMVLLVSAILAYLLETVIRKAETKGIRRVVAVSLLYLITAGAIVAAEMLLAPYLEHEIRNFYTRLPEFSKQIEDILASHTAENGRAFTLLEEVFRKTLTGILKPLTLVVKAIDIKGIFDLAAPFLMALILVPFFVFFLLKDWPGMRRQIMAYVPPRYVETTGSLFSEINILVGRYLRGLALDCIAVSIIASIGLWIIGVNYPISLGIMTGAANIIPYAGPIMACVATTTLAVIQQNSLGAAINVLLLYVLIKLIDDLLIQPLTVGKSVKLHPMLLIIAILSGEKIFGIIGMIIAVPMLTIFQKVVEILIENKHRRKPGMAEQQAKAPVICL